MRFFIAAIIILFLVFILSPFISLFLLPDKFLDHSYRLLSDRVIADRETVGLNSKEEIILKLFAFTHNHIFLPKGATPYAGKPLDYLIKAIGWCDYQAKVFNVLLSEKGIPSRYAMLMDKDGVSRHTISEVYFHNRWAVFDPLEYTCFKLANGEYATLDDLSQNPEIIFVHPKLKYIEATNKNEFEAKKSWYKSMFPLPMEPVRSAVFLKRITIFDRILDLYAFLFGRLFTYTYQDIYLKKKLPSFKEIDYRLFYAARNYKFYGRRDLAINTYLKIIKDFPDSKYCDDSIFFLALLYADLDGDYKMARTVLNKLILNYPDSEWMDIARDKIKDTTLNSHT